MFGRKPQMAAEEYKAVAGVWRVDLSLHPALQRGDDTFLLHLAAPQASTPFPSSGTVYTMEDSSLPMNICPDKDGWLTAWWAANRHVRAGTHGDDTVSLSLQLGSMFLDGQGFRGGANCFATAGLRCQTFSGKVLYQFEEEEELCVVGSFSMRLSLPTKTDTSMLENRYRKRIATRQWPPSRAMSEDEAKRVWLACLDEPSRMTTRS